MNLSITSPTDGGVVNQSQPVLGTINHLCRGQHLWLVLQIGGPGGGDYYPQNEVAVASNAGRWSTTAYFGQASKKDDGLAFTVFAVVADDSTDQDFRAYLEDGRSKQSYRALPSLGGATILSEIAVTRGHLAGTPPSDPMT
jgi:hypothetical protein